MKCPFVSKVLGWQNLWKNGHQVCFNKGGEDQYSFQLRLFLRYAIVKKIGGQAEAVILLGLTGRFRKEGKVGLYRFPFAVVVLGCGFDRFAD